jgi:hypothetical protein
MSAISAIPAVCAAPLAFTPHLDLPQSAQPTSSGAAPALVVRE